MAGPCVGLYLANCSWPKDFEKVRQIISQLGHVELVNDNQLDCYFTPDLKRIETISPNDWPFLVCIDDIEPDENELRFLESYPELNSKSLVLCANCSGSVSAMILAKLALVLLNEFGGYIDFTGKLDIQSLTYPGELLKLPYLGSDGELYYSHLGDKVFLEYWMRQNDFYMIK